VQYPDTAPAARPRLRTLVQRAGAQTIPTRSGRYTQVHVQTWSLDTTGPASDLPPAAIDEQLWLADDRSGRHILTPVPATPTDHPGTPTVIEYPPHQFQLTVDNPSDNPMYLAAQMSNHDPASNGPQAMLRALADMHRQHALYPRQQAAALQVLVDTDGLTDRGTTTDRRGRTGVAITADSGDTASGIVRDIAVFDPTTGALLSFEQVVLLSPPRSALHPPAVVSYVLFLAHDRTDQLNPPSTADTLERTTQ